MLDCQNNEISRHRIIDERINVLCSRYVDIAVENYYALWKKSDLIKKEKYISTVETREAQRILENAAMVVIVFSSMAIESYLNDYAASCLGDDEFYDGFDKLNVLDKLRLIVQFIFRIKFVKDQPVYTHIRRLMSDRNKLVHNKSEDFRKYVLKKGIQVPQTLDEVEQCFGCIEEMDINALMTLDKENIDDDVKMANNAIRALRETAAFVDKNDPTEQAYFRLLGSVFYKDDISDFEQKKINVFQHFQIPTHLR